MLRRRMKSEFLVRQCSVAVCLLTLLCVAVRKTVADARPSVLELRSGDFVRGRLLRVEDEILEWDSDHFARPLRFPFSAVRQMKLAPLGKNVSPEGEFAIELCNRDMLFGDVKSVDGEFVVLGSPRFGEVKLRSEMVRRISRNGADAKIYRVPTRLRDWTTSKEEHWRMIGGHVVSDEAAATLYADVNLPAQAAIEVELAWSGDPNFALYLGTNRKRDDQERAFSIEAWGSRIVAQRRSSTAARVAPLQDTRNLSLHIIAYLDQDADKLIVYDTGGKLLAELDVPVEDEYKHSGIMLCNRVGNVKLKQLQIRGWSGAKPDVTAEGKVMITAKETHTGDSLQVKQGEVTLIDGEEETQFNLADITTINLPATKSSAPSRLAVSYADGSRISGELLSADSQQILVRADVSDEVLHLPILGLRGFAMNESDQAAGLAKDEELTGHRMGSLELMDTRLTGCLVEASSDDAHASCLVWKGKDALEPSPLMDDVYGRISYQAASAPRAKKTPQTKRNNAQVRGFFRAFGFGNGGVQKPASKSPRVAMGGSAVHLRSGDAIPCKVLGIDQQGVRIESSLTESKLIPHAKVKAAQLKDNVSIPRLAKTKRDRLLTLPRVQRDSPPLHLLFSSKGDVLRGSVMKLSEDEVELEIRLGSRTIPTDRVAAVVWLHAEEIDNDGSYIDSLRVRDAELIDQDRLQVQVLSNGGSRFSFFAESFSDQTLHGQSDVLKTVHANVADIDQLLLGGFIHRAARSLPFHRWTLTSARDPKFVTASGDGPSAAETTPGTESNLVGQLAPDIQLTMLDGSEDFRLAEHRGHCVVLDFWASWCGPCLQVMPQVEEVVAEFSDEGVQLYAINLEERPEQIKATLERRGLDVQVALDRDGVAAARYEATAIPQTVVVGPDGKVTRVFVGSSRKFADQLRAALAEALDLATEG